MRYGQLVIGPAGSGKSTYCAAMSKHAAATNRMIKVINLDPAAEHFEYEAHSDVRTLISIDDVMDASDVHLGPNGGLMFCMQYLVDNISWLTDELEGDDDDYVLFDCPGQIELYTHMPLMRSISDALGAMNFRLCAVFLLDTQFMLEVSKFLSGSLVALSSMVSLELPAVNVLSKMDLVNAANRSLIDDFLQPNAQGLMSLAQTDNNNKWDIRHKQLTETIAQTLDEFSLVKFTALDITDEESVQDVLLCIDCTIQYGEDADVKIRYPEEVDEEREEPTGDNGLH